MHSATHLLDSAYVADVHPSQVFDSEAAVLMLPKPEVVVDSRPVDCLGLSTRARNCLKNAGIFTVDDLTSSTEEDLRDIRNFGARCFREVQEFLDGEGLQLAEPGNVPSTSVLHLRPAQRQQIASELRWLLSGERASHETSQVRTRQSRLVRTLGDLFATQGLL